MEKLQYPYQNFYAMLRDQVRLHRRKTLMFIGDAKMTYARFLEKVDAFARFLEIGGFGRGDRVALIAPNSPEFVVTVFAATKIGMVVVPVNHMLKASEFEYILNDAGISLLVTSESFAREVGELHSRVPGLRKTVWIDRAPQIDERNIVFDEVCDVHAHEEEGIADMKLDDLAVIF